MDNKITKKKPITKPTTTISNQDIDKKNNITEKIPTILTDQNKQRDDHLTQKNTQYSDRIFESPGNIDGLDYNLERPMSPDSQM